jgi:hypothetical protein
LGEGQSGVLPVESRIIRDDPAFFVFWRVIIEKLVRVYAKAYLFPPLKVASLRIIHHELSVGLI